MENTPNKLILCVDLDEWYHCRWATGSPKSRWQSTRELFREYYHSNRPAGEIIKPTQDILGILKKEKIKATFFILGEVAEWYPGLVKAIAKEGHEIAAHGFHHQDLTLKSKKEFARELAQTKKLLQKLSGQKVIGFRAPNLIAPDWLSQVLLEQGFKYDSSICPGRSLQGKYQNQAHIQPNPYRVGKTLKEPGQTDLFEIPIPTFPILKLPGAVSIATRIFGLTWTKITLNAALKTGATSYYLHPYEFNPPPKLGKISPKERIFLRRTGPFMRRAFVELLKSYRGRIISAKTYLEQNEGIKVS